MNGHRKGAAEDCAIFAAGGALARLQGVRSEKHLPLNVDLVEKLPSEEPTEATEAPFVTS